jgi:hypothetical protein
MWAEPSRRYDSDVGAILPSVRDDAKPKMTPERSEQANPQTGVLAALPRTRPQRASARRVAAREGAKSETTAAGARSPAKRKVEKSKAATEPSNSGARASKATKPPGSARANKATKPLGSGARANKATTKPPSSARASKTTTKPPARRTEATKARAANRAKKPEPPTPRQGYEPEDEIELGKTVDPPSGGELIESLADIFGELASAGATAGARVLKDALSIFRRP